MKTLVGWFLSLAAVTILAGCGGAAGGTCGNTAPCGGDIVGTWKVSSSCISYDASSTVENFDCPGATVTTSGFKVAGNANYNADLTYSSSFTVTGNAAVTIPSSCLMIGNVPVSCAQLQLLLQANAASAGYSSATCTGAGSGCVCTLALAPPASASTGTYTTTSAGLLSLSESGGGVEEDDYCVKGPTLSVSQHEAAGMMGQLAVSGTITLTKQ